ncbi:MAG: gliding motility-associated ABC transporter ATP-binding subunit GldA [Marinilabiliales bacterium]|nr:MAG: gliding motility-associated ABC transporter ATP-binding subunit GldA [Marinilabiliales bacterium]
MGQVKVNDISKFYGEQKALNNVNLQVDKGEVVGLLGPNGAGKSTLMKILTSFLTPTSGTASINGFDVQEDVLKIKQLIGYLPEHNPLYHDMYVKEYLRFVLKMYKFAKPAGQVIDETILLTGLEKEQHKKIGALSKGYRQRVGLAQALIHDPEILILDEPTSGLDPNQIVDIRKIITDLGKEKTVILSTHIMQEVEAICDRVIIIDQGKIVADDSTRNLSGLSLNNLQFRVEFKEDVPEKLIRNMQYVSKIEKLSGNTWLIETEGKKDIRENIFKFAVANNYNVLSLSQSELKMEDVFRRLTKQ